jgi:hypothetical protein
MLNCSSVGGGVGVGGVGVSSFAQPAENKKTHNIKAVVYLENIFFLKLLLF